MQTLQAKFKNVSPTPGGSSRDIATEPCAVEGVGRCDGRMCPLETAPQPPMARLRPAAWAGTRGKCLGNDTWEQDFRCSAVRCMADSSFVLLSPREPLPEGEAPVPRNRDRGAGPCETLRYLLGPRHGRDGHGSAASHGAGPRRSPLRRSPSPGTCLPIRLSHPPADICPCLGSQGFTPHLPPPLFLLLAGLGPSQGLQGGTHQRILKL